MGLDVSKRSNLWLLPAMLIGLCFVGIIYAANEKRTQLTFQVAKDALTMQQVASLQENLNGNCMSERQLIRSNGWSAINLQPLSNLDLVCIINDSPSNFVQLALSDGTNIFAKLTPGRVAFFPPDPAVSNILAKADTTNCTLMILLAEP